MWWNLFERVFIPILLRLSLKISNLSCLLVQTTLLRSRACSVEHLPEISVITLKRWIAAWYDIIWVGVHFLQIEWIFINDNSVQFDITQDFRALADIDRRACFIVEHNWGVNHWLEIVCSSRGFSNSYFAVINNVNITGLFKSVTKMVTGRPRTAKLAIFVVWN